jgi:hypothetical protein
MTGVYVQFGSGFSGPDRWFNYDASPTLMLERLPFVGYLVNKNPAGRFPKSVRYGDIIKGLPVADGTASGVYASHVLEHLSRTDFATALHRTFTMLKPGGRFRLVVPDLEWRARAYLAALESGQRQANDTLMRSAHLGMEKRSLVASLGNSLHLWMWDEPSMTDALLNAGFVSVRRCKRGDSGDPMFDLVEEEARFVQGGKDELAMEALRPT